MHTHTERESVINVIILRVNVDVRLYAIVWLDRGFLGSTANIALALRKPSPRVSCAAKALLAEITKQNVHEIITSEIFIFIFIKEKIILLSSLKKILLVFFFLLKYTSPTPPTSL